ncbi:MAG: tRNA threonylcarbamoyladenosine biosynthesis protein TsaB [Frankiaceae bacterium]|nr:tRNA threonylcarbamoyladenosine biosynthesis protein TsaB [Frankiaceae bacterium]
MLILAFDTSTPAVTVAVLRDDDVLAEQQHVDGRRHGEVLAPSIADALASAELTLRDVDFVAVGNGPGPFTGLRVGLVTARSLSHALGIPAYGVCSLDALAAAAGAGDVFVATDARRREVYWARYRDGVRTAGPDVARPADVEPGAITRIGHGVSVYADLLGPLAAAAPLYPPAAWIGRLVGRSLRAGAEPDEVSPLYLRRPDAEVPKAPKAALPA